MFGRKKRGNLKPHQSTLLLNIKPMLAKRNIVFPTAFMQKAGISNTAATKIMKGDAVQVNLRQLTALCLNLNCTPNDLFVLRDMQLPEGHELHTLKTLEESNQVVTIREWVSGKSVQEMEELMKK